MFFFSRRTGARPVPYRIDHSTANDSQRFPWTQTRRSYSDVSCAGMTELRFLRFSPLWTRLQLSAAAWWLMWRAFMWKSTERWKYINRWPPVNFQCLDFNAQCRFLEVDLFKNKISPTWCKPCTDFFFWLSKQSDCAQWIHFKGCSRLIAKFNWHAKMPKD